MFRSLMLTKVTLLPSLLVCFSGYFFQVASRYQNVSIQDFIGAKDDGGGSDSCSCKTWKASVRSSPTANQHPDFYSPVT